MTPDSVSRVDVSKRAIPAEAILARKLISEKTIYVAWLDTFHLDVSSFPHQVKGFLFPSDAGIVLPTSIARCNTHRRVKVSSRYFKDRKQDNINCVLLATAFTRELTPVEEFTYHYLEYPAPLVQL